MPYTENTRIKVVNKRKSKHYTAQVEYRWPLFGFKEWVDFEDSHECGLDLLFFKDDYQNPASFAICEVAREDMGSALKGEAWAKAIIDKYHEVLKDRNHKDTIEYIKYPD